jgi:hypothetical protein
MKALQPDLKGAIIWVPIILTVLACGANNLSLPNSDPPPTPTLALAQFATATPTSLLPSPTSLTTSIATPTETATLISTSTPTPRPPSPTFEPLPTGTTTPLSDTPTPELTITEPTPISEPAPTPVVDFVLRRVRMRTNEENSWDGTLGPGQCGSDHSIYVYVADAQENLLDGILVGDKYGNFEVPTGVDGKGMARILVWSAAMELAVMGHQDGTRYTSDFTPLISTLDEQIPLDWLQGAGYCDSPEDCQWRVENNQLCRGHYSYDVIFQRTW